MAQIITFSRNLTFDLVLDEMPIYREGVFRGVRRCAGQRGQQQGAAQRMSQWGSMVFTSHCFYAPIRNAHVVAWTCLEAGG